MEYTIYCPCCGHQINLSIADGTVVLGHGAVCDKSELGTKMNPALIELGEGGETNIERAHHTK